MSKGPFESLIKSLILNAAVQSSNDENGKPDPYKAAGTAFSMMGNLSDSSMAVLGAQLGAQGAFDDDETF